MRSDFSFENWVLEGKGVAMTTVTPDHCCSSLLYVARLDGEGKARFLGLDGEVTR